MKTSKLKVFGCFQGGKEQEHNPKMGFTGKNAIFPNWQIIVQSQQ